MEWGGGEVKWRNSITSLVYYEFYFVYERERERERERVGEKLI